MKIRVLIAEGRRSKAIGEVMGISAKTVDTYRRRIMAKLGFKSQIALMRYASRLDGHDSDALVEPGTAALKS